MQSTDPGRSVSAPHLPESDLRQEVGNRIEWEYVSQAEEEIARELGPLTDDEIAEALRVTAEAQIAAIEDETFDPNNPD